MPKAALRHGDVIPIATHIPGEVNVWHNVHWLPGVAVNCVRSTVPFGTPSN
jgi:hypothetical protein